MVLLDFILRHKSQFLQKEASLPLYEAEVHMHHGKTSDNVFLSQELQKKFQP
jgi:hypothetical protein